MIIKKTNLNKLSNFGKDNSYLSIVERKKPRNSDLFFKDLLVQPISICEIISKNAAFSLFFEVFGGVRTYSDLFGYIRMHSEKQK